MSTIKEMMAKNKKERILIDLHHQTCMLHNYVNTYIHICLSHWGSWKLFWNRKDGMQTKPANLTSFLFLFIQVYTVYTCLSAFKGGSPCFFGSHPISIAHIPSFCVLPKTGKTCQKALRLKIPNLTRRIKLTIYPVA